MRSKGTIVQWNDDRGFGFIEPTGGGNQIFCHVKAFDVRVRRPVAGDNVTYEVVNAKDGRLNASKVRPAGLESARYNSNIKTKGKINRAAVNSRRESSPLSIVWSCLFALLFFAGVVALILSGRIPFPIIVVYLVMSSITIITYMTDKIAAMNRRWRTEEGMLHLMELIGGWPGALIAQQVFRHKSRKGSYRVGFIVCAVMNVATLLYFAFPEWRTLAPLG